MQIEVLSKEHAAELDAFVAAHPWGSIEQSWMWGELQTRIFGRPEFRVFGVFEEDELVGSMLVIRQVMGYGKMWLWCPRGPLLPEEGREECWELLKTACRNWARLHGAVFLRVEPGFAEGEFDLGGWAVSESYVPGHTLKLDLEVSERDILAQMAQKGRYNIKVAERHGVKVTEGGLELLPAFYLVFKETAVRDGFFLHEEEFYRNFLELLGDRAALYVAHVGDDLVGGIVVTFFGNTGTYYFGASGGKHREAMAPYALQWHAVLEAKKRGMKQYDFFGVAPEGDEKHVWSGVTQFKTRFGGERADYEKARVFVYRRVWWWLYRMAKNVL